MTGPVQVSRCLRGTDCAAPETMDYDGRTVTASMEELRSRILASTAPTPQSEETP